MTAPSPAERIDAATALMGTPFVAGLALLVVFAVAWVFRAERPRRRYLFESDLMQPWSDREPGDLGSDQ
jgi:hypothetical protein